MVLHCVYCHKGYKTEIGLTRHVRMHYDESHRCLECVAVFFDAPSLRRHYQQNHSALLNRVSVAIFLSSVFSLLPSSYRHYLFLFSISRVSQIGNNFRKRFYQLVILPFLHPVSCVSNVLLFFLIFTHPIHYSTSLLPSILYHYSYIFLFLFSW